MFYCAILFSKIKSFSKNRARYHRKTAAVALCSRGNKTPPAKFLHAIALLSLVLNIDVRHFYLV